MTTTAISLRTPPSSRTGSFAWCRSISESSSNRRKYPGCWPNAQLRHAHRRPSREDPGARTGTREPHAETGAGTPSPADQTPSRGREAMAPRMGSMGGHGETSGGKGEFVYDEESASAYYQPVPVEVQGIIYIYNKPKLVQNPGEPGNNGQARQPRRRPRRRPRHQPRRPRQRRPRHPCRQPHCRPRAPCHQLRAPCTSYSAVSPATPAAPAAATASPAGVPPAPGTMRK